MHTERITYLSTAEHKAALEAFAQGRGESVGSVVREATAKYMGETSEAEEAELAALVAEANQAIPAMAAALDNMIETVRGMRQSISETLAALSTKP